MLPKKNPEADLERRKSSFTYIGLLTALAVTLVAFEWTAFEDKVGDLGQLQLDLLEEEVIPPSATPPPPPRPLRHRPRCSRSWMTRRRWKRPKSSTPR